MNVTQKKKKNKTQLTKLGGQFFFPFLFILNTLTFHLCSHKKREYLSTITTWPQSIFAFVNESKMKKKYLETFSAFQHSHVHIP